ncbi:hypothetical protein [Subtercola boreus]|uniref:hypothetical protein n=1 Tax=Subtercola boreus TaxID=120213 RepID=UPI001C0ED5B5|nr:hypothetical protein [Subtercola boreus]
MRGYRTGGNLEAQQGPRPRIDRSLVLGFRSLTAGIGASFRPSADAKRAKAEGFEIVTGADGVTRSIPVTAAAKAATGGKSIAKASPNGTVSGGCGISSPAITRTSTANIREVTSYRVNFPSVAQNWGVDAISRTGGYFHDFSGLNASTTWTGEAVVYVSNSTGVTAHVSFGSFAEIIGGGICYSGNPTSNT